MEDADAIAGRIVETYINGPEGEGLFDGFDGARWQEWQQSFSDAIAEAIRQARRETALEWHTPDNS